MIPCALFASANLAHSLEPNPHAIVNPDEPVYICRTWLGEKEITDVKLKLRKEASSGEEVVRTITTTAFGQLSEILGENLLGIDRLIVNGPVNAEDFNTMWEASFNGNLHSIDLSNSQIENNALPDNAFWHADEQYKLGDDYISCIILTDIVFPESLEYIGDSAFSYAINLKTVNFPSSLKKIGRNAFSDCIRLTSDSVDFPEGFNYLGEFAFVRCSSLVGNVSTPSTLKEIRAGAFFSTKIISIEIAEGLEKIGEAAFYACRLESVVLPESCSQLTGTGNFELNYELKTACLGNNIEIIPPSLFENCYKLETVNIPANAKQIGHGAFKGCQKIQELELPEGLESVDYAAFEGLSSLRWMSFPSTLRELGAESCKDWKSINWISCRASVPPICIESGQSLAPPFGAIGSAIYTVPLYVPIGASDRYRNAYGWSNFSNIIESEDVTVPAQNYFSEGMEWQEIRINTASPDPVTHCITYFLDEPYELNGRTCYPLRIRRDDFEGTELITLLFPEGDKVYCEGTTEGEWRLMYDFGLQEGQTVEVWEPQNQMINCINDRSVVIKCNELTMLQSLTGPLEALDVNVTDNPVADLKKYWIKGIGSSLGVLRNCDFNLDGIDSRLIKATFNGEVLYEVSAESAVKSLIVDQTEGVEYFNLQGQRVADPEAGQLVIKRTPNGTIKTIFR